MESIKEYQTVCAAMVGAFVAAVYYFSKASLDKNIFKRE